MVDTRILDKLFSILFSYLIYSVIHFKMSNYSQENLKLTIEAEFAALISADA